VTVSEQQITSARCANPAFGPDRLLLDYHCSHWTRASAEPSQDEVWLSDL
jgi:hypothetical protein